MARCPDCRQTGFTVEGMRRHRATVHNWRPDHGTNARYMQDCRCQPCKTAHAKVRRDERHRIDRKRKPRRERWDA